MKLDELQRRFHEFAGCQAAIYFAPGRINLIGEHTDYAGGLVLPASIGLGTWVAVGSRDDDVIRVRSESQQETVSFEAHALTRTESPHWSNYVKAVAWALKRSGHHLHGSEVLIASNVPLGSGLSSSASLEVAIALALLARAGETIGRMQLAQLCQTAENDFVGMRCGLMDQFASLHGVRDRALLLDCGSLEWRTVALPPGHRWVVANTMVHHAHASGEYNTRRAEFEQLQELMRKLFPQRHYLHELDPQQLAVLNELLTGKLTRRLRHLVSESGRVQSAVSALEKGDCETVGRLLSASHQSLRDDFEVSCPELDIMVEIAVNLPGVLGTRMLGGGFGGCTLSLVKEDCIAEFVPSLQDSYRSATNLDPWIHVCDIGQGAGRVA